jgi:hypothetical protein
MNETPSAEIAFCSESVFIRIHPWLENALHPHYRH